MIKALIFDMDGVIVDNDRYHFEAWHEYALRLGRNVSFDEVKSWFGNSNATILKNLTGRNLSGREIIYHSEEKEKLYRKLYEKDITPVNGLRDFLDLSRRMGIKTGLATLAPPANVDFVLRSTGLMDYFDAITDDAQISNGKPDPEIFLITAQKLETDPGEVLVFEDSFHGIEAARRAGMKVVGVATTHEREALLMSDMQIDNFMDLTFDKLKTIWKK